MTPASDDRLYARSVATLIASWETIARGSVGAATQRLPGVVAAVFPNEPERSIYNNAVLDRGLDPAERTSAVEAMQAAYVAAGVEHHAAWVHESEAGMAAELSAQGYAIAETTRVMGMPLSDPPRRRRSRSLPRPRGSIWRIRRRHRPRLRPRRRLRHLQHVDPRARPPPRHRHRSDRPPPPRSSQTRLPNGHPPIHPHGRARLRVSRLS